LPERRSRSLLADTVRLVYTENTGGFLSLGANLPPALRTGVFTIATAVLLLRDGRVRRARALERLARGRARAVRGAAVRRTGSTVRCAAASSTS